MNYREQLEFLERHRNGEEPLVLATVFETAGSTYSKAGARMLVDGEGRFRGMLSGGCLEGDLAMRARVAIESGAVQYADYDLGDANDELWGMGVGCDGVMRIMLQPLYARENYEPASFLLAMQGGRDPVAVLTCIESTDAAIPAGSVVAVAGSARSTGPRAGAFAEALKDEIRAAAPSPGSSRIVETATTGGRVRVLADSIPPVPRILVLGAGPDAVPLVRLAAHLGWRCTVSDHRPAYVDGNDFAAAEARYCLPAGELAQRVGLDQFDMAIVMSHHLASDRAYLRQLAASGLAYIGLLGPPGRRDRLLEEIDGSAETLRPRVHGPAGLDLGGRGPSAIALSIVAEMQLHLASRYAFDSRLTAAPTGRP
jgi:xanthine/CO dehydrogenase XdhC/CoxF family maturation factor